MPTRNKRVPRVCTTPKLHMIPKLVIADALGAELALRRREANVSQVELASGVGINPSTVSALERGRMVPSLPLLLSICNWLGYPLSAVIRTVEANLNIKTQLKP